MTYHLLSFLDLCILQEPVGSYSYRSALGGLTWGNLLFLYFFGVLVVWGNVVMDWDGLCFIGPPAVMGLVFFYFLFRSVLLEEEEEENMK